MTIAIVLAAGKGTRMRSNLIKVAHPLAGLPLICHVHAAIISIGDVTPLYVLGYQHDTVQALLPEGALTVHQEEQLGTGHAVGVALAAVPDDCEDLLVLYGDMPLISSETLESLRASHRGGGALVTLLSADVAQPHGYGRVIRDAQGRPTAIMEEKWLAPEQHALTEINTGVYAITTAWLRQVLPTLPANPDGEIYLTDLAARAAAAGGLAVVPGAIPEEVQGINDRVQLAMAERVLRRRINERLMRAGVTFIDPETTHVAADAAIGADTIIEPNVWIGAGVTIGEHCHIGANSRIVASSLGNHCTVLSSVIEYAELADRVDVGPFTHLRAGSVLGLGVHIGNFAEIKNSLVGAGTRMGHFSYLGDATVGSDVNIGAGTVTANYDGSHKFPTTIGDRAFIGVGTMLRAPVTVGDDAATGAGAVVTHDVAPGQTVAGVPARPIRRRAAAATTPAKSE